MKWSLEGLELGRVLGFPLLIQNSFIQVAPLAMAWPVVTSTSTNELLWKLALLPLAALSVLAHELGHGLVAKHLRVPVRRIALTVFGGFAEFWVTPTSRLTEIAIAAAGPLTNLSIAALTWLIGATFPSDQSIFAGATSGVFWFNLCLGLFNLLPGLPLDGGHIFRALLSYKMSLGRAGWIASWVGTSIGAIGVVIAFAYENVLPLIPAGFVLLSSWRERRGLRYG